jgi:hypothetical protein
MIIGVTCQLSLASASHIKAFSQYSAANHFAAIHAQATTKAFISILTPVNLFLPTIAGHSTYICCYGCC